MSNILKSISLLSSIWNEGLRIAMPGRSRARQVVSQVLNWKDAASWAWLKTTGLHIDPTNSTLWKHPTRGRRAVQWDDVFFYSLGIDWREDLRTASKTKNSQVALQNFPGEGL